MSDAFDRIYEAIDAQHVGGSTHTRRRVVAGAASTIGALGLMGVPDALARKRHHRHRHPSETNNTPKNILAMAATAEVLATIVNTLAPRKVRGFDAVTTANLIAAAREELIHYNVLTQALGGRPLTKQIFIPDRVFASPANLLNTVIVGDQIFINAYLIGTTVFGDAGNGRFARATAEFMGVEAVHRAVARQSLGLLGNDRAFIKYDQSENAIGPMPGLPGFTDILKTKSSLELAGFGFGVRNPDGGPGEMYDFDTVSAMTPDPLDVNTRIPA